MGKLENLEKGQVQTRKKDERFSHLDFAISPSFIFKGQKTEKMTMTYSRFRFRSDRQFLNLKARIRKIQTLQFLHLFSKGKKTITHSRFRFRSDFSFIFPHASTRRHRLRLLLLLKVRKSQKIYVFLVFNSSEKPAKICPNFCPSR